MYVLAKIGSAISSKPVEAPKVVAAVETTTTGIPGIETPAFETFLESAAFEKLLENDEQLGKAIESA